MLRNTLSATRIVLVLSCAVGCTPALSVAQSQEGDIVFYKNWQLRKLEEARLFLSAEQVKEAEAALKSGCVRPWGMYGLSCYLPGVRCDVLDKQHGVVLAPPFSPAVYCTLDDIRPMGKDWSEPLDIQGKLVFAGYGLEGDAGAWSCYGKDFAPDQVAVIIWPPATFTKTGDNKSLYEAIVSAASRHKVAAIIVIGPGEFPKAKSPLDGPFTLLIGESWGNQLLSRIGIDVQRFRERTKMPTDVQPPCALNLSAHILVKGVEYEQKETEHFCLRYRPDSQVATTVDALMRRREDAFLHLTKLFGTELHHKIQYIIYPDEEEKVFLSAHLGAGYGSNFVIGEDHGERADKSNISRDDYHEITHITSIALGAPVAMFEEGLGALMGETRGRLEPIMQGDKLAVDVVCARYLEKRSLWPIEKLITFTEIGSPFSKPLIAYPQSASIAAYLIRTYGWDKFKELYRKVKNPSTAAATFEAVMGTSIKKFEVEWKKHVVEYTRHVQQKDSPSAVTPRR